MKILDFKMIDFVLFSFFFTGCQFFQNGNLEIQFENEIKQFPLTARIDVIQNSNSNSNSNQNSSFIPAPLKSQELTLQENKNISLPVSFSDVYQIKLTIQDQSVETLLLPYFKVQNAPKWWQSQNLIFHVKLQYLEGQSEKKKSSAQTLQPPIDRVSDNPPQILESSIQEETIEETVPDILLKDNSLKIGNKISQKEKNPNSFEKDDNKKEDILKTLTVQMTENNQPLENVSVYFIYKNSQSYQFACETLGKNGICQSNYFSLFPPAYLLVYKEGYEKIIKEIQNKSEFKIDLKKEKNPIFFGMFQYFYEMCLS